MLSVSKVEVYLRKFAYAWQSGFELTEVFDLDSQADQLSAPTTGTTAAAPPRAAAPAKPATPAAVVKASPDPPVNKMRRRIVWATVAGSLITFFLMFVRFFLPRSILEPSSTFRIGSPNDYALGVDTKWQQQYRVWVTRTSDRLFVIYARCTHLGCTPDWKASENKFKCPCHGSGYDSEGINFEGPAPRPMDRAKVKLDAEGQIVVDVGHSTIGRKARRPNLTSPALS